MALLGLIIILLLMAVCGVYNVCKPASPAVKDWDKFNRETIGKSNKYIKHGLKSGRW